MGARRKGKKSQPSTSPPFGGRRGGLQILTPNPDLPTGYFSASSLEMFYGCGIQWYYRYVEGLKAPPSIALVEGSSHHEGLHMNNQHKIKTGNDHKPKKVFERVADYFSTESKKVEDWEGEKKDVVLKRGKTMVEDYMKQHAPYVEPVFAEKRFETTIGGIPFLGFIDLGHQPAKKKVVIADYKVTGLYWSEKGIERSMQFCIYAEAENNSNAQVIVFQKKLVTPKVKITSATIKKSRRKWLAVMAQRALQAIKAGIFLPAHPDHWRCTPKRCGYWGICKEKGKRK